MTFWFSSLWCDIFLYLGYSNEQSIFNQRQEIKLIIVSIMQNRSQMYSNHNNNIKYVDSTIKYIDFESFRYVINLNVFYPLWFLAILIICFYRCINS